jgi:hypothetical protein
VNVNDLRPGDVCRALLAALDASDGRRKKRKRDQTPDAIGLAAKRALLERAVLEDPDAAHFEEWLQRSARDADPVAASASAAMAQTLLEEWRLVHAMPEFAAWLEHGAPSEDSNKNRGAVRR